MKNWSKALSRIIPHLITAFILLALGLVSFAFADGPSALPSPLPPSQSIGGWVHDQGGFVAALVALMLSVLAILKAVHDVCIQLHIQEPGWLGAIAGFIAKVLSYLTANTTPKPVEITTKRP